RSAYSRDDRGQPPSVFYALRPPPHLTLFPYTTLFRSRRDRLCRRGRHVAAPRGHGRARGHHRRRLRRQDLTGAHRRDAHARERRSEEHTSELQSPCNLVCRLLLEKKKYSLYYVMTVVT